MYTPMNKIYNYFKKTEIKSLSPVLYKHVNRKKIVTFVPLKSVDKITFELANAGAGKIGNYTVCSFRMKGVGTFVPGKSAKPFSGKVGKLSFEEEVRLEMECGREELDDVIDALLANHPYEEPAYEVYDFVKRTKDVSAYYCELKNKVMLEELIYRLNNKVVIAKGFSDLKFSKLLLFENLCDEHVKALAKKNKAEVSISFDENQNNIKLI
jgi:hypothetical protein